MTLTGFAGQLVGWAVLVVAYAIVIMGIVVMANTVIEWLIIKIVKAFNAYRMLFEFIIHRKDFKKYWKHYKKNVEWPQDF